MNIAGMMAKYFETSFMIEKVVSAPRVIRNCLPMATTSISFVGLLSRSTMLPASRAAVVPVFMARPTSACASAGASLVPSPVIAIMRPPACSFLLLELVLRRRLRQKSSTPASDAMAAAVSGSSPVTITERMPIARSCAMRSFMPTLTMSFRLMMPSSRGPSATASGVPPEREILSDITVISGPNPAALLLDERHDGVGRALSELPALDVHAAHLRERRERNELRLMRRDVAAAEAVFLLCEHHDRTPFRRLIRQAGQLGRIGEFTLHHA